MTKLFFVYGTLKRGRGNTRVLGVSKFVGEGITEQDSFYMYTNGGFPYVLNNGKFHVKGELFEVSDPEIEKRLDWLEGVPTHYVRASVPVRIGEDVVQANMYVASASTSKRVLGAYPQVMPDENNVVSWGER